MSMTTTMNISLPETLKEFVKERTLEKSYSNPSDYVRALIRADQKRRAEERLNELLIEGLSSPAEEVTAEDWAAIRHEVRERLAAGHYKKKA